MLCTPPGHSLDRALDLLSWTTYIVLEMSPDCSTVAAMPWEATTVSMQKMLELSAQHHPLHVSEQHSEGGRGYIILYTWVGTDTGGYNVLPRADPDFWVGGGCQTKVV